jgi:MFS family permease
MGERLLTRPFVLACLATFGALLAIGILIPVLPLYAKGPLDAGSVGVGLAVASASATALLLQPIAGRFGDRVGRRPLLVAGGLILGMSFLLYTVAASMPALVPLRLLTGVGEALVFVATATMINDLAPPGRRGEAVSLYSLATWGGLAIGPPLGELVLGDDRFDAVWLGAAAAALASALLALGVPETRPPGLPAAVARSRALLHRAAVTPGLVLIGSMVGFAAMAAFGPLYARELGLSGAGLLFTLNASIVVAVRLLGRRIPDRVGPKRTATAALAIAACGPAVIAIWQSPAGLYAGTVVLSVGQSLVFPALMMIVVSEAPEAERSSAVGSFTAFADLGYGIGAISLGAVAAATGYNGVFAVAAVVMAAGLLPLSRLRPAGPIVTPAAADAPP